MTIPKNEGAGRFRLNNGRRMSIRAYRETMEDRMPISPSPQYGKQDFYDSDLLSIFDDLEHRLVKIETYRKPEKKVTAPKREPIQVRHGV